MSNKKLVKGIGFATTIIGVGISLITNWVSDKKLEIEIEEKVAKALAEKAK